MSEQEGVAGVTLREAARGVLPEVIDADFPSVITSPNSFTGRLERMIGIADRWQALRAALSPTAEAAPDGETLPIRQLLTKAKAALSLNHDDAEASAYAAIDKWLRANPRPPEAAPVYGLLERLVDRPYNGGYGGTCYECPFASPPLRSDGSEAEWSEVANDPTEAYFRCSLPGRVHDPVEWGEYAPCSPREWFDGVCATPEAPTYTPGDNVAAFLHRMGMPYSEANSRPPDLTSQTVERAATPVAAPRSLDAAWAAELDRLEALARAATPGPWAPDAWGVWTFSENASYNLGRRLYDADEATAADAAYIAAVSPDVILALTAKLRERS